MSIIEIKVTLQDIEPAVTRTLQVPADIRLHLTLQVAMGWTNSHLYMFEAARATWGIADPDFGGEDLPANKTTLGQVIEDTGKKTINYIYDFGDNWEHRIKIGRITDPVPGELYPRLIEVTGIPVPRCHGRSKASRARSSQRLIRSQSARNRQTQTRSLSLAKRWKPENQGNKAVRPDAYHVSDIPTADLTQGIQWQDGSKDYAQPELPRKRRGAAARRILVLDGATARRRQKTGPTVTMRRACRACSTVARRIHPA